LALGGTAIWGSCQARSPPPYSGDAIETALTGTGDVNWWLVGLAVGLLDRRHRGGEALVSRQ